MCTVVISEISENDDTAVRGALKKFPELVVLHDSGRTYGNVCLMTFKVGDLGTHTLAHSILPMLEAPVEGFVWNLPE